MTMSLLITHPGYWAASYMTCCPYPYMMFKRDSDGNYILLEKTVFQNNAELSNKRCFTDDKVNVLKNLPIWFIQSFDDPVVPAKTFSFPVYKELLKKKLLLLVIRIC